MSNNEIKCPKCGNVFKVDEASYANIVKQVHDAEFDKELAARIHILEKQNEADIKLAKQEVEGALEKQIAELKNENVRLEEMRKQEQLEVAHEREKLEAAHEKEKLELEALHKKEKFELEAELKNEKLKSEAAVEKERVQLSADYEKERAQLSADYEKENMKLKAELDAAKNREQEFEKQKQTEIALAEEKIKGKSAEDLRAKEDEIAQLKAAMMASQELYEEKIAHIKEFNERMSTKMIGESLENFCHNEFEKIRATAYPNAIFGKDNEVSKSSHSKGDFIFRDIIDGMESVSIMFECKNEDEETEKKQKNEKFFKELDKDRREKKCEYAILVSTLEKDNDFYNQGIAPVSSQLYPKMYVVRPQFFIPILNIIALSARQSFEAKRDLELKMQEDVDLTNFEENLRTLMKDWGNSAANAFSRHCDAIKGIDKIIESLEKVKGLLETSNRHLNASENKLEKFTIRRLTKNAPSVAEKLAKIREGKGSSNSSSNDGSCSNGGSSGGGSNGGGRNGGGRDNGSSSNGSGSNGGGSGGYQDDEDGQIYEGVDFIEGSVEGDDRKQS